MVSKVNAPSVGMKLILMVLGLLNVVVTSCALLLDVSNKISLDAKVVNVAGQIRGGTQRVVKEYAFRENIQNVIEGVDQKFLLLEQGELAGFVSDNTQVLSDYHRAWKDLKDLIQACPSFSGRCYDDVEVQSEVLWRKADQLVAQIESGAQEKLQRLNLLYWLFLIEFFAGIFLVYVIYVSISRKLERQHIENQKFVNVINKHVASLTVNNIGQIVGASEAFCAASGYVREVLIGKPYASMVHPDEASSLADEVLTIAANKACWFGEMRSIKHSGEEYWVDVCIDPALDGSGFMAIWHDVTDKKRIDALLKIDALTNISNRAHLDIVFEEELQRAKRYSRVFSIVLLDIDFFKQVNDFHGHLVGDEVLKSLAALLQASVRSTDFVGRWGGEEFLIICPETQGNGALKLAETIRRHVEAYSFDHGGAVTCSFGVAVWQDGECADDLLKKADDALYMSKNAGRNQATIFSDE